MSLPIFVPTRSAERFCLRSSPTTNKSLLLILGLPLVIPDPTVHEGRPCLRRVLGNSFPSARCFITIHLRVRHLDTPPLALAGS